MILDAIKRDSKLMQKSAKLKDFLLHFLSGDYVEIAKYHL